MVVARNSKSSEQKRILRRRLRRRKGGRRCCFCRCDLPLSRATLDHTLPASKGGDWSLGNLKLACWACNQRRGVEPFWSFWEKSQHWLEERRERALARAKARATSPHSPPRPAPGWSLALTMIAGQALP